MKKLIALLLAAMMLLSLAACGETPTDPTKDNDPSDAQEEQTEATEETEEPTEEPTEAFDPSTWGVSDRFTARNDQGQKSCYINLPKYTGVSVGGGKFAEQPNGVAILYHGQHAECPEISGVSELFPAYFDRLQYGLEGCYGSLSKNFEFTLSGDEAVTVGDYDMHTFEGLIAFDYDGEHREYQFVAYATTLKSNGAYAYWVVYDVSGDQSNGDLIAEYAYNMARTFREEE